MYPLHEWVPSDESKQLIKTSQWSHIEKKSCVCKKQIHHKVIAQVYSKPVTKSLLVPIDFYNMEKVLWKSMGPEADWKNCFSLLKTLTDGVEWCGLLWCFYQLFGLLFWRHPFTADEHCWTSDVMLHFSKWFVEETNYLHLGWPEDEGIFIFILDKTIPLSSQEFLSEMCFYVFVYSFSFSYFSTPSGNTISAAELTCALLMSLSRYTGNINKVLLLIVFRVLR